MPAWYLANLYLEIDTKTEEVRCYPPGPPSFCPFPHLSYQERANPKIYTASFPTSSVYFLSDAARLSGLIIDLKGQTFCFYFKKTHLRNWLYYFLCPKFIFLRGHLTKLRSCSFSSNTGTSATPSRRSSAASCAGVSTSPTAT